MKDNPQSVRVVSEPCGSDEIMMNTLFLGTYPGLTYEMLQYEIQVISSFIDSFSSDYDNPN